VSDDKREPVDWSVPPAVGTVRMSRNDDGTIRLETTTLDGLWLIAPRCVPADDLYETTTDQEQP
jgi:hypothetical protein